MLIDEQKPVDKASTFNTSSTAFPSPSQQYADPPPYYEPPLSSTARQHPAIILPPAPAPSDTRFTSGPDESLPLSFSRQPPPHLHYDHFPPLFLIAKGDHLDKGFPICPPPSHLLPHPFITHDVNEGDWTRLLEDIRKTAMLTQRDADRARSIPIVNILPILNSLVEHAIRQHLKRRKAAPVSKLIETWNHHFFHPRKMEVVLMHGQVRLSGDGPIPDADVLRGKGKAVSPLLSPLLLDGTARSSDMYGEERSGKLRRHFEQGKAAEERREEERREEEKRERTDKTYRLFVVAAMV